MRIDTLRAYRELASSPTTHTTTDRSSFSETLRPKVKTPMTEGEAFAELSSAWERVMGTPPDSKSVSILWAQWAMETARGTKMYGHNFSGIKGVGPSGMSLMLKTSEGYGPTHREIRDRFRAYANPAEGATDYVRLLKERYPEAIEAASRGDTKAFVHEIRRKGYFTGEESKYASAVGYLSSEAVRKYAPAPVESPAPTERREPIVIDDSSAILCELARRWTWSRMG